MNWSTCWISRRAQEQPAPMISSTFLRSPQKTCGLFDTGLAGDSTGITSSNLDAPAEQIDSPFLLNSLNSAVITSNILMKSDAFAGEKLDHVQANFLMDSFDLLDPLADLETDQLADSSLDAFINLDKFLIGDSFEAEEVKSVFDISEVKPVIETSDFNTKPLSSDFGLGLTDAGFIPEPVVSRTVLGKRKAFVEFVCGNPVGTIITETSTTDAQLDHDYTNKCQKMSVDTPVEKVSSSKGKVAKVSATCLEVTSSSDLAYESINDKQAVRRMKNNVASKRSREQRKKKFVELDIEAEELIKANTDLRQKILELEELAREMKAQLVERMVGKV